VTKTGGLTVPSQKRKERRQGRQFTLADFYEQNPISHLVESLTGGAFRRGVPKAKDLSKNPQAAVVLRRLLTEGSIRIDDGCADATVQAIKYCNRWIHFDATGSDYDSAISYVLPSPLHSVFLSWLLLPQDFEPLFPSILDMAFSVISRFKRSQMFIPIRRAGIGSAKPDKPPEAQYQDEFYRALHDATSGAVRISPEFASARGAKVAGRIDFFIPVVKWGIEITREGSQLDGHSSRFEAQGAYGAWLKTGDMEDYILLDCCTALPQKHSRRPIL
jgi:hypothetical protein